MPRVLPHNIPAERWVIGACLFGGNRALARVADRVEPDEFSQSALGYTFAACLELDRAGMPIDLITVTEQLRRAGTWGHVAVLGGEAWVAELTSEVATLEGLEEHAKLVRGCATKTKLILGLGRIADRAYDDGVSAERVISRAQQLLLEVDRPTDKQPRPFSELLPETVSYLEELGHAGAAVTGIPTGYWKFDGMTAGLQDGDLVILAARPSMGKTALALEWAINSCVPTLVFSLEMGDRQLAQRSIGSGAELDLRQLRTGLRGAQLDRARRFLPWLAGLPIQVLDTAAPSLRKIRSVARRWRLQERERARAAGRPEPRGMIIIDYLQLIGGTGAPRGRGQEYNREREVSEISRGLKALAKDLQVPVVALSQLNRSVEARPDKRPRPSDLRESGAVEQDADLICFIYRDEVYKKDSKDKGIAEVIIAKQRNGPVGTVRLKFRAEHTRFENDEPPPPSEQQELIA